jgi:outer membrane protein OmpA-like peptidoglycan-associated protein
MGTVEASQKKSSGCGKILLIFFVIIVLLVAAFAGLSYWGFHKVKETVEQKLQHAIPKTSNTQKNSSPTSSGTIERNEEPCPVSNVALDSLDKGMVPIRSGLTLTSVWTVKKGDYEDLMQISSIDHSQVNVRISGPDRRNPTIRVTGQRNVCLDDLRDGNIYITVISPRYAETIRDATEFSLSQREFETLKNQGAVNVTFYDEARRTAPGKYELSDKSECAMSRIEKEDVPFAVIVNDRRVELPTIHTKGMLYKNEVEFYFLDDKNNPLLLYEWIPKTHWQAKVLKISYPEQKQIEKQLAEEGKVQIYGIYFDFNSANIRTESEPVLKEIAEALNAHQDWKLTVNGHTDNIGGASYNMELSNRRAAAVKQALVDRYNISPDRLTTAGFGMSQPIETNDTPEGRARNRRVELIKR